MKLKQFPSVNEHSFLQQKTSQNLRILYNECSSNKKKTICLDIRAFMHLFMINYYGLDRWETKVFCVNSYLDRHRNEVQTNFRVNEWQKQWNLYTFKQTHTLTLIMAIQNWLTIKESNFPKTKNITTFICI